MNRDRSLPVLDPPPEASACNTSAAYVTLEEKAVLDALRRLRLDALEVRQGLEAAGDDRGRVQAEADLAALRHRRRELVERREQAFRRKMIMLGHLPPDDLDP